MKPRLNQLISTEIREVFQNQNDSLVQSEGRKILISHLGEFSQDLVNSVSASAEELLISSGDRKMVVKRLFSIIIEGLQNIRLHGKKDEADRQLGYIIVSRGKSDYKIIMANIVSPNDTAKIEKYIDKINTHSEKSLKELYMEVLTNEFLSEKGGAGLGFITTRMKSKNPINYSFYALKNEHLLFTLEVRLNRDI